MALKNGLHYENNELIYYKDDVPKHAGVIRIDNDIYYISSRGKAVKGEYIVHGDMANGILERGTYTFGDDYKLVAGSYIAPKKKKKSNRRKKTTPKPATKGNLMKLFKLKMQEIKHKPLIVSVLAGLALFVIVLGVLEMQGGDEPIQTAPAVQIELPEFTEDVLLCSDAAKMEYDGLLTLKAAVETGNPYRPFYFEYTLMGCSGTLFLGEQKDFSDARQYDMPENTQYVAVDNLKVDTTYYYKVVVNEQEFFGSFHTAPATRFVYIPGLVNTRDIGGGVTLDGKKVKQGMLIRGVEMDGLVNSNYFVPQADLETVKDTFGFVYDMDLRHFSIYSGTYRSRLDTPHAFYSSPQYGEIFTKSWHDQLKGIFSALADPEKYPMYLHCTWGRDRTGTIVFLLQGLLNMSEDAMQREYLITAYVDNWMLERHQMDVIVFGLQSYAGETLQEKIYTFLTTEVGVTEEEIASIRSIFLQEAQ